jgi:hypothetical protein
VAGLSAFLCPFCRPLGCFVSQSTRNLVFSVLAAVRPLPGNSPSTTKQPSDQGINQRLAFLTLNANITKNLSCRDGFQRYHEGHAQGTRHSACLHQQSCCIEYSPSSFGITPQRFRERSRRINNECQQTEAVKER